MRLITTPPTKHHINLTNSVHSNINLCAVLPPPTKINTHKHQHQHILSPTDQTQIPNCSLQPLIISERQFPSSHHPNTQTVKMVEPLTLIVIPLAVTFSAIICATAVQKRWQMRNIDDGNKYNRMAHKSRRFRHRVTGKPVPPKFECPEGCRLT
ncbi:hypothetical protein Q7P36_003539 [Cladosporium allicinum]|jgi:hypothetical protein